MACPERLRRISLPATPTIALQTESPAIDAGSNPNDLATDQRDGFARTVGNATDIGAFELQTTMTDSDDLLTGTDKDDTLEGFGGNDTLDGGASDDLLDGGEGDDTLLGSFGRDTLNGGFGNDSLDGGTSDDRLLGDDGDDTLTGGNGRDTLDGGIGNDLVTGGNSNDTFVIANDSGIDTITDFGRGNDSIGLSAGISFEELSFSGSDLILGTQTLAILDGFDTTTLSQSDFVSV